MHGCEKWNMERMELENELSQLHNKRVKAYIQDMGFQ